ncbi:MAG: hypothetical protein NVSMB51_06740 [Solirubrobacteraceae bacterium]
MSVFALVLAFVAGSMFAPVRAHAAGDPLRPHQWGLDLIGADQAQQVSQGQGAIVAVVDTGVKIDHPDLAGRLLPGHDFVAGTDQMHDGNGHGTHVAGIIAADKGNGIGIAGVAPLARILPVRVLGDDGSGSDADVGAGIDYAVAHGANVINLSLGGTVLSALLPSATGDAVQRAIAAGVVVVAAAGNDSLPLCEQPGAGGRLLCVGALDRRGQQSFFSSNGLNVNVFAPGGSGLPGPDEDILSTWNDGAYMTLAGTSQATPHVSGVAALLAADGLRGQTAVQRILATRSAGGALSASGALAGLPVVPLPTSTGTATAPPPPGAGAPNSAPALAPKHRKKHRHKHKHKRARQHRRAVRRHARGGR